MSTDVRSDLHADPLAGQTQTPEELYLDLLKRCLTRLLFVQADQATQRRGTVGLVPALYAPARRSLSFLYSQAAKQLSASHPLMQRVADPLQAAIRRRMPVDVAARTEGRDWPVDAETMIGLKRLNNIQQCLVDVLRHGVPGDVIETGAWRGGATIFMRGVLKAYGDTTRTVWVADSFRGLPKPDAASAADSGDVHWTYSYLAVPVASVQANFARYGLLDNQVNFLVGWFRETLPTAPIEKLALLRVDGDMYDSTMDALAALYPKLSPGGYVIVDDYNNPDLVGCKKAVDEYREAHGIAEPIQRIDWQGVFWQRTR